MDRITMAFGPISDVTGFSHKAGMTYLEIQEVLRRKLNELIAAHASLKSHVDARNADVVSAFDQMLASFTAKFNERDIELVDSINAAQAAHTAAVNDAISTLTVPAAEYAALSQEFDGLVVEFNDMMDQLNSQVTMTDEEIVTALGG